MSGRMLGGGSHGIFITDPPLKPWNKYIGLVFGEVLFPLRPLDFSGHLAIEAFGFELDLLVGLLGKILLTRLRFYSSSKK